MDTRTKIISVAEAARLAADGATVVSGYFDPLLASHAERLHDLKREGVPLLVAIADPETPILPARARAELTAGLAVVDYVVESVNGVPVTVRLEEEDAVRLDHLIEHVHARQKASV
jgi:bifunctional ADP-heptose synthase (sugar kinase/adenylyltransferase)